MARFGLSSTLRRLVASGAVALTALGGPAQAEIENTATATATYGAAALVSAPSVQFVPVAEGAPKVSLLKTIDRVEDTNNSGRVDTGDTVFYTFNLRNLGNLTLEQITLSDPEAVLATTTVGPLAPYATDTTLTASYVLQQADIDAGGFENSALATAALPALDDGTPRSPITDVSDAGDEAVETAALDGTTDNDPTNDPTVLAVERDYTVDLAKSFVTSEYIMPFIYDVTYKLDLTNYGNVTATNLTMRDDMFVELAPAVVVAVSASDLTGFTGTGGINPAFDGNLGGTGDAEILTGDVQLAPDATGSVNLTVRLQVSPDIYVNGELSLENQAHATAEGVLGDMGSYNPDGGSGDAAGPTSVSILDSDSDGAADGEESTTEDRDGDGIADAYDYDPTGYFYCEETGEILTGGRIRVVDQNGSSANVRIVTTGADGSFQWFVTEPGTYTMTYDLPSSGVASEHHLPQSGALDLGSFPTDPASLGSNENRDTGVLVDFTATANPFYTVFDIQEGDPHLFNNNIPLQFCGTPNLVADKTLSSDPVVQPDGRSAISYAFTLTNDAPTRAATVGLIDDLTATFGAFRAEVVALTLDTAPATFTGTANAGFDGGDDTAMLTSGGYLDPGESLTLTLDLLVNPRTTATYTNTVIGTGNSPLTGATLDTSEATADVDLIALDLRDAILLTKTATPSRARVGDVVAFTITIENTSTQPVAGLTLIDSLPRGLVYRPDTATVAGNADEPDASGRTLGWTDIDIAAGETITATLATTLTSRAETGTMTNQTWMTNAESFDRITEIAEATVALINEPVFDCGDVIGKVFNDTNMNGYQDGAPDLTAQITDQTYDGSKFDTPEVTTPDAEKGVPNARLVTPTGTVITTDDYGRYSVPCAELPQQAGANFTLKLDPRSLPSGFRVTTENPRTLRLTPGIMTEMNFGAALGRLVEIDLTSAAFDANGKPSEALTLGLENLLRQVAQTPSVVKLNYFRQSEGSDVARTRLDATEDLLRDLWGDIGDYKLIIERSVARF